VLRARLHEQEIRRAIGVVGKGDLVVDGVGALDTMEDRCLYFVNHDLPETVRDSLATLQECIVIVRNGSSAGAKLGSCRLLAVPHPRLAIARILEFIRTERRQPPLVMTRKIAENAKISPLAVIEGDVEIAEGVAIEPFCTVGPEVVIGRGSVLRSGSRVFPRVSIGEETIIGANAVIGSAGFGFVREADGNKVRIPHLGGVSIGSHVEIGALSFVQSGTILPTTIEDYAKIDDNVAVGHNARIGRGASVTGGVVIGGSAVIGPDAWIGINSSIRDGRRVGSGALVGMNASVQDDLADHAVARAPRPDVRKNLGKKLTP